MKIPLLIADCRLPIADCPANSRIRIFNRKSQIANRKSRQGVALVITLILLSVVTLMAVAFLALSRRERGAVTASTDQATAKLAADAALANAEAQIVSSIFATTNPYSASLLVSTNYINSLGFTAGSANPTNVNYNYPNGTPVTGNDLLQNIANLFYLPRAPVFVPSPLDNYSSPTNLDFRFYLDLNRNGRFDANGVVTNVDNTGRFILDGFGNPITNSEVGDPEWIGILSRPDQPHGPNNYFVARYAFIAAPADSALDLNAIHNQVFDENNGALTAVNLPPTGDNYFRNQGVGTWEINLAAFLADLNTNQWGEIVGSPTWYQYNQANLVPSANSGRAFNDACALLAYRYNNYYPSLATVGNIFTNLSNYPFNIDGYSDGPLQTTFDTNANFNPDVLTRYWAGADNTNHFFSDQDLFDTSKTAMGVATAQIALGNDFSDRLVNAGTNTYGGSTNSTYDRYTFYRLLSQLGTDSSAESGKININYSNAAVNYNADGIATSVAIIPNAETNFVSWTPTNFFTAAVDRMLRVYTTNWFEESPTNFLETYYGIIPQGYLDGRGVGVTNLQYFGQLNQIPAFGITNIPVYVNGQFVYSSAVNRLLQLAANIYDATTNNMTATTPDYPSVFRPLFSRDANAFGVAGMGTNIFISGYTNVVPISFPVDNDPQLAPPIDAEDLAATNIAVINMPVNVYGVPWIIGAKKGFPNFNEFAMQSGFQITRKLQVTRQSTNTPNTSFQINQMFLLSITNQFGVECWNSYVNNYTYPVAIYVSDNLKNIVLTNDEGNFSTNLSSYMTASLQIPNPTNNVWPGYNPAVYPLPSLASFQIPLNTNLTVITNSMYRFNNGSPSLSGNLNLPYETNVVINGSSYPQPHWGLKLTNDLRVIILDTTSPNGPWPVIDYVQLRGPVSIRDLTGEILREYDTGSSGSDQGDDLWETNLNNQLIPYGINNQIGVSLGLYPAGAASGVWDQMDTTLRENEIDGFRAFYGLGLLNASNPGEAALVAAARTNNAVQAPYSATATTFQHVTWQANDPLVHYIASDLQGSLSNGLDRNINWPANIGKLNDRYMPWGGNVNEPSADVADNYNLALKDPLVYSSDNWDFPTNKFPGVGWLGRVHRGTPWQTVYLKSSDILGQINSFGADIGTNTWMTWTGDGNYYDAANAAPVQDRLLFDLFTTAFNDNATRGQLSVNIPSPNLAAWSALFSGVVALTNTTPAPGPFTPITYGNWVVQPAGAAGSSINSPLGQIANGILQARLTYTNADGLANAFEHIGDILRVPELTDQSPFLNWSDPAQQQFGINDEMYEWLPQQVMSLLRDGSTPRYVIYCYGQTLKPAPNSLVTSSSTLPSGENVFGMCTNYQVVSEFAARAVVRVENAPTPENPHASPHVVIEQFNVLPPD